MPYYFHYTNTAGFKGIAGGCGVKKDGQFFDRRAEPEMSWNIMENQPQKGSWYADQHDKGFYLTDVSPDDLKGKKQGKLGLGKLNAADVYLFIFWSDDKSGTLAGAGKKGGYSIDMKYSKTNKFFITAKKIDAAVGNIYLAPEACVWCGPISSWDAIKGMME